MSKYKLISVTLMSALLFSACTSTSSSVQKKPTELAKTEKVDSDTVCFKIEKVGSHMKQKRCISKAQAAEEKRAAQEELKKVVNDSTRGKFGD